MLQVKYGLITLIKANESLCEQMEKVDKSCPLEKGDLEFQKTVQLPAEIPPVSLGYTSRIELGTGYEGQFESLKRLTGGTGQVPCSGGCIHEGG